MKKRLTLLCSLLLLSQALFGCAIGHMERQTFPLCMTIDLLEGGKLSIAVQAPQNGTSGGDAATPEYEIISATGTTLQETLHLLSASTPYPINYCQLELCILGYGLASTTEVRALLRELLHIGTMRHTAVVAVALGNAHEVMRMQVPNFGMRLSTHFQMLFAHLRDENLMPDSTMASVVRGQGEGRRDHLLCLCAVNPTLVPKPATPEGAGGQSGGGSGGGGSGGGGGGAPAFSVGEPWQNELLPENIVAGMLPHTSSNPVEFLGAAAIGNGRVSGVLTANETQLVLNAQKQATPRVAIEGNHLQLQLLLPPTSELYPKRALLLAVMEKLQLLHCDALGFGGISAGAFLTDAAWEAFDFKTKYKTAEWIISTP